MVESIPVRSNYFNDKEEAAKMRKFSLSPPKTAASAATI
jgi:hypothetical protein